MPRLFLKTNSSRIKAEAICMFHCWIRKADAAWRRARSAGKGTVAEKRYFFLPPAVSRKAAAPIFVHSFWHHLSVEFFTSLENLFAEMKTGTEVVCIDDRFSPEVAEQYAALPVRDTHYHIRHIYEGRTTRHKTTTGVLLVELHNPPDIVRGLNTELGFEISRFREVEEVEEQEEVHEFEKQPAEVTFS